MSINQLLKSSPQSKAGFDFEFNSLSLLQGIDMGGVDQTQDAIDNERLEPLFSVGAPGSKVSYPDNLLISPSPTGASKVIGEHSIGIGSHYDMTHSEATAVGNHNTARNIGFQSTHIGYNLQSDSGQRSSTVGSEHDPNEHDHVHLIGYNNSAGANSQILLGNEIRANGQDRLTVIRPKSSTSVTVPSDSQALYQNNTIINTQKMGHVTGDTYPSISQVSNPNVFREVFYKDITADDTNQILFSFPLLSDGNNSSSQATNWFGDLTVFYSNTNDVSSGTPIFQMRKAGFVVAGRASQGDAVFDASVSNSWSSYAEVGYGSTGADRLALDDEITFRITGSGSDQVCEVLYSEGASIDCVIRGFCDLVCDTYV